jgi:hypothetical protein
MVSWWRAFVWAQGVIISNDLKLPWSGYRNTSWLISWGWTFGAYWTTNLSLSNAGYQLFMNANLSPGLNPQDRNQALSIRCFKN